jgi:molybdopterin-guanine dinucleotide biosynthesis protein B
MVYSVAGFSKSGKTTLMTQLIGKLKAEGYITATIKDCPKDLTLDTEGKDTWKHKDAGAELAVLTTNIDTTILYREPRELDEVIELVKSSVNPDLILVEGHKQTSLPKIWIPSDEDDSAEKEFENIVYDYDGNVEPLFEFITRELKILKIMNSLGGSDCGKCGFETCHELAVQILEGKNEVRDCQELPDDVIVEFTSGGEKVQLNKFANNIIAGTITGMAKELKGLKDPDKIEIRISKKQK